VLPNNKFSEQRAKKGILKLHLIPFFGKMPMRTITTHHVEQFKAHQVKVGVASKTLRNRLTVLSKCLSCAHDWQKLDAPPPKVKWPKCPPPKTDYLSPEECELLLSNSSGVINEMVLAALRTGMRQGELKGLQWSSIDWQTRSVAIRHSYCDVRKVLDTPKSNRERHIPLDMDVLEMLHRRKKNTGYLFLDGSKPFNSPRLNHRLAKVCQKAGLRKITWHVLRHTFASQLAMRGVPLNTVQALLGHSSIMTTMRYAHVAPSTLRFAIDMLNPKTAAHADFGQPVGNHWMQEQKRQINSAIFGGR
jgi:integrase